MKQLIQPFTILALSAFFLHGLTHAEDAVEIKRVTAPELSMAMMKDVITPHYDQLQQASTQLVASSKQLCNKPSPEALSSARKAYLATLIAWRKIEIAPIGPSNNVNNGRIFESPAAPLADLVEQGKQTPDRAMVDGEAHFHGMKLPDGTIGMPAIASLLFHGTTSQTLQLLKQDKNCAYLQWQTQVTARQITVQQYEWTGLIRGAAYDVSYPGQFVTEYLNRIIAGASSFRNLKLSGEADNWQDAKTGATAAGIAANVQGLKILLEGKDGGIGLDDYLISRDKAALWQKAAKQLAQLEAASTQLDASPNAKTAEKINLAADQLANTLKTEVAPALNIRTEKK
ncbi:imelysin family protein [Deefgea rivuli]|uniref:imelysin family protein n=1 Tax=Deefgea rivuli TaxID=400948 RepID=UPI0004893575|nr:imelysin family protein [Deefgea rivuli]